MDRTIFFTVFPRKQGWPPTHSEQAATGKGGYVYYLAPGSSKLVRVATEDMGWDANGWPNGIVGTPNGKKLPLLPSWPNPGLIHVSKRGVLQ